MTSHEDYVQTFNALSNGLLFGDQEREIVMQQADHLLDKHALDYPEIVIGYQLGRLLVEAEAIGVVA
jgi:hypothetical protein